MKVFAILAALVVAAGLAVPRARAAGEVDGKELFAKSCGWCHQDGGRRAGRGPKLAGSGKDDAYIAKRIRDGKQGAMPAFRSTFDEAQIAAIVDYIRSLEELR